MNRKARSHSPWPQDTEILGVEFDLRPVNACSLFPQYAVGLHAWFLDQVRQSDPHLSTVLHDGESEKPFTLSRLQGPLITAGSRVQLHPDQVYHWTITALKTEVVAWLAAWLPQHPSVLELRYAPLQILGWRICLAPSTYAALMTDLEGTLLRLSFISPTSFRRKGHHLPLPWPTNVFQSYLRRWNDFSHHPVDPVSFLEWVDESVLILSHRLETRKVPAGKKGSVTGFMGEVEFGLTSVGAQHEEFSRLYRTLGHYGPYCGTGHKTVFGLGQTRRGGRIQEAQEQVISAEQQLGARIEELETFFMMQRKRLGGERAQKTAQTWATILARREMGESLQEIAEDLEMPYGTVKTYVKLARRSLQDKDGSRQ